MLSHKRCYCIAVLLILVITANAQQAHPISLKELLNRVNQKAPQLQTDSSAILIRQAEAVETNNNWLPNLRLNYQADIGSSNNIIGPYFGFGIVPSSTSGVHSGNVTTAAATNLGIVAFDWEVYNFGKYAAENKVANSNIVVEKNQFAASKYNLQAFTISNYLQLLRLQDFIGIQYRNIQRNQEIVRSIRSLALSGVKAGVDTSIANAELSKARLNYIELDNQLKQVQLQLSAVTGIPYLTIVPDSTVETVLINQPNAYLFQADTANHPLISFYRSVYQNSLQREALVKKQYSPKIFFEADAWERGSSISPTDQYNALSTGFGIQRSDYLFGLGISYNLFDLKRKQLKLRTQKTLTDYNERKLLEQQQLLSITVSQADVDMQTALKRLQEIPNQLRAASASYRQQLSLYRNGLSNIIDLDAAVNILYRAETDYMQAKYDFASALFQKAITGNQVNTILNILK